MCVQEVCACVQRCVCLYVCVGLDVDLTMLHSYTLFSSVTELVCALDHSSNAFALAQECRKIELHFSW